MPRAGAAPIAETSADSIALRKAAHRTLAAVEENLRGLRFNVAVARIYELANAIASALTILPQQRQDAADHALGAAIGEALEMLVHDDRADDAPPRRGVLGGPRPHRPGGDRGRGPSSTAACSPRTPSAFRFRSTVKKRGELTIATDASQADVEAATLALDFVQRALEGRKPRKIVVVPKRIVNVVI